MKENRAQVLTMMQISLYSAMFVVLDIISNQLPIFKMPNGGTLGLGVIVLLIASYKLGWKGGLVVILITVALQFVTGPLYSVNLLDFVLEYIIAFGVYSTAVLFKNYGNLMTGIIATNMMRLAIHTAAGVWFSKTTWWASLSYNAWYMIPTMLVALITVPLLLKRLPKRV